MCKDFSAARAGMPHLEVRNAVVKGHHVYQHAVAIGDIYECFCEPENIRDPKAVAIYSNHKVIGHVPTGLCSTIFDLLCFYIGKIQVLW